MRTRCSHRAADRSWCISMAKAFIASDRGSRALAALLAVCALACNTFDDPGDRDGDLEPPTTTAHFTPPNTVPAMMMAGSGVATSPPSEGVAPPGVMSPSAPCVSCMGCMNTGGDCSSAPGGIPEKDEWLSPFRGNGEDGWEDSTTPLCSGLGTVWGTDVVRDGGTVYVMVHGMDESPDVSALA